MDEAVVLCVYCGLIVVASLVGGMVPGWVKMTHRRMQVLLSLVAGFVLGIALLHLLPHAMEGLEPGVAVWWVMAGLVVMLILERFLRFHHHEVVEADSGPGGHVCDEEHPETDHGTDVARRRGLTWVGAGLGLVLHSLMGGLALAAAVRAESGDEAGVSAALPGLGVFLVIVLHKPLDAMTLLTLIRADERVAGRPGGHPGGRRRALLANVLFALVVPLGVVGFALGLQGAANSGVVVAATLAFATGVFLHVSLSDLIPELHAHGHDRLLLTLMLMLGIGAAACVGFFEHAGHGHGHGHGSGAHVQPGDAGPAGGPSSDMMPSTGAAYDPEGHDHGPHDHSH